MKFFTRRFRENLLVTLCLAAVMSLGFATRTARLLDARFSDLLFLPREPVTDIAIVAIDDKSIAAIGQWPWKRSVHARLIDGLSAAGARAIGYDVNFPEKSAVGAADDAALVRALTGRPVVLPVELTMERVDGEWRGTEPLLPLKEFTEAAWIAGGVGTANVPRDADGVAREVSLAVPDKIHPTDKPYVAFAALLYAQYRDKDWGPTSGETIRINFAGAPGTYPRYSATDILNGRVPEDKLRGKIVLVGATAPDLHDDLVVPTSHGMPMPGVEVHANILETLIRGNALRELPVRYGVLMIFLYTLLVGMVLTRTKLRYGTSVALALAVFHVVFALWMFEKNVVVPMVWPLLSVLITYVVVVAIRYFHEQRERMKLRSTLNQYLSPAVVADLLANPEKIKLGGERRTMTVLFSDLRGFTTLSEGLPPEMLVHVLNVYLDVMTEKVFATNGVIDKYMGDAIMAFWGASFLESDHADRAIMSAILMRETLNEMNRTRAWPNGVELNLGIGVNTGEMVVGNMGSSKRFDYTVMGDAVNLGSRIEGINKEYGTQIIASEFARKAATAGKFVYRELDLVAVKGKKEPVAIFEVVGLADAGAGFGAVSEETLGRVARFEEALRLYRAQQFEQARVIFAELAERKDYAAAMYVTRCEAFLEHSPGADWNGVWVFTKK